MGNDQESGQGKAAHNGRERIGGRQRARCRDAHDPSQSAIANRCGPRDPSRAIGSAYRKHSRRATSNRTSSPTRLRRGRGSGAGPSGKWGPRCAISGAVSEGTTLPFQDTHPSVNHRCMRKWDIHMLSPARKNLRGSGPPFSELFSRHGLGHPDVPRIGPGAGGANGATRSLAPAKKKTGRSNQPVQAGESLEHARKRSKKMSNGSARGGKKGFAGPT